MTCVLYYSFSGSTRSLAEALAHERGADLIELREKKPCSRFGAFLPGCPKAMRRAAVPLAETPSLEKYDNVVLMAPIWAGFPAPAFNSALPLLPKGCTVELILVSASGEAPKSKAGTISLLESKGHTVLSYRDVATGKSAGK